jgi:hypothetical protein
MVIVPAIRVTLVLVAVALLATGCASSAGSIRAGGAVAARQDLAQYRALDVRVTQGGEVKTSPQDLERLRLRIIDAVNTKAAGRFQDAAAPVLEVSVVLTRYDEGNAFARFMLAGLGQIHIDGRVSLKDRARGALLGEYEVTKTFAWGGVYGASTGIQDVEQGFAQAVAGAILGED